MSLSTPHTNPDGRRMMVESSVLEIDKRLKEGDSSVGWVGDPGLWLEFDQARNVFIVCRYDPNTGAEMDVMSYPPPLDAGLLIKLRDGDTQRAGNDPLARLFAEEDAREKSKEREFDTFIEEESAPRLVHAMRQDGMDVGTRKTFFAKKPPAPLETP